MVCFLLGLTLGGHRSGLKILVSLKIFFESEYSFQSSNRLVDESQLWQLGQAGKLDVILSGIQQ